jgi:hypothetical protein
MPVDYSNFLQQVQPPDYGNVLARSAQMDSLKNNNLLAHAQLDDIRRQGEFRNALSTGADQATLQGIDPMAAQQYEQGQNSLTQQRGAIAAQGSDQELRDTAARQSKAQYLSQVLGTVQAAFAKGDAAGMAAARYYWPEVKAKGFFPGLNAVPDDPAGLKRAVDQFKEHADLAMAPPDPQALPSSAREFQLAAGNPEYAEFLARKSASGKTTVQVNMPGEDNADKLEGEAYQVLQNDAQNALDERDQILNLRRNPAITGPTQDGRAALTTLATDLGIPVSEGTLKNAANLQGYKAAVNGLVLRKMQAQKGPQTENDAKRIEQGLASTKNVGEANALILDYNLALADRKVEMADFADRYREANGSLKGFQRQLRTYVRETPLTGLNKKSGRLVFWPQYKEQMRVNNPNLSDQAILQQWRSDYAN